GPSPSGNSGPGSGQDRHWYAGRLAWVPSGRRRMEQPGGEVVAAPMRGEIPGRGTPYVPEIGNRRRHLATGGGEYAVRAVQHRRDGTDRHVRPPGHIDQLHTDLAGRAAGRAVAPEDVPMPMAGAWGRPGTGDVIGD